MINDVISRNNQQNWSPCVNTNTKKNYSGTKSPFPEGEKGEKSQSAKSGKKLRLRREQTYKAIREIESWWWTESSFFYKAINKLVKWVNSINWPSFKRNQPSKKSVVKWRWKNLEFCRLDQSQWIGDRSTNFTRFGFLALRDRFRAFTILNRIQQPV